MSKLQDPALVVDDEADVRDLVGMVLMKVGLYVQTAVGAEDAKDELDNDDYSLVLIDMRMSNGSGLEVVQYINELMLDTPVAATTTFGNTGQAVETLKAGALDYLQKPIIPSQLRSLIKSVVSVSDYAEDVAQAPSEKPRPAPVAAMFNKPKARPPKPTKHDLSSSVPIPEGLRSTKECSSNGEVAVRPNEEPPEFGSEAGMPRLLRMSPQMVKVRHLIRYLARSGVPVYVSGKSGTDKEQAARTTHELSDRVDKPFIVVNCGAIPENLMESEFFGYKRGSFTGAGQDRLGSFQHVDGDTLFLDEVADLLSAMQVKLLRAIQEKVVQHIDDTQETSVDVRIICAIHENLEALVESGAFCQDLHYRLNVVTLRMPPLCEIREDMGALALYLLYKHRHGTQTRKLSPKAQEALLYYSYPGDFRELEGISERAVVLTVGQVIQLGDLQIQKALLPRENHQNGDVTLDNASKSEEQQIQPESLSVHSVFPPFDLRIVQIQDYLDQIGHNIIEQTLQQTRYNRTQATKLPGIGSRSVCH